MSNQFGKWVTDEFDLPAFEYTLDQNHYDEPMPTASPIFNKVNDHYAQFGNDNIIGIPSNYGYVRIREDEGGPKFLNDYNESKNEYAGGFGFWKSEGSVLSTYYTDGSRMKRQFGSGYFSKDVENETVTLKERIYAPFGCDPVMKDDVTIENKTSQAMEGDYYFYYGCSMLQFSSRGFNTYRLGQTIGDIDENTCTTDPIRIAQKDRTADMLTFRREFDKNFEKDYTVTSDIATCSRHFTGYHHPANIETINKAIPASEQDRTTEDLNPPIIFLASLNDDLEHEMILDAHAFLEGGPKDPAGLKDGFNASEDKNGMILRVHVRLEPNETKTISCLYGYVDTQDQINVLVSRYTDYSLLDSIVQFKEKNITGAADEEWVERETLWNSIYLRQSLTYDTYFKEHILSQGGFYQYIWGFQGAIRDQIQHAMPFLFYEPKYLREIIRFSLKQMMPDGRLPWAETGFGMEYSGGFEASDQELYVIWAICEYVLATKDWDFLDEVVQPAYPDAIAKTVLMYLKQCMDHFIDEIGLGENGFVRIVTGDWSDSIIRENISEENKPDAIAVAESGFNTTMAVYALSLYADVMKRFDVASAKKAQAFSDDQRQKILDSWNGKWFPRAMYRDQVIGADEEIWLESQIWLLAARILPENESAKLIANIKKYCMDNSPIGAKKRHKLIPDPNEKKPSDRTWWSVNGILIWGLNKYDPALAYEEWKKNSLHTHETVYPHIWYGIWSGSEAYESPNSKLPGYARYNEALLEANQKGEISYGSSYNDFPVNIIHPHAWPLYTLARLTCFEFTNDGIALEGLPAQHLEFNSPLYSYAYDGKKTVKVKYCSKASQAMLTLNNIEVKNVFVDGQKVDGQTIALPKDVWCTIELQ